MGAVAKRFSYSEYVAHATASDGLWEFHDGVVVGMVAPSPEHARIIAQLVLLLRPSESSCLALPSGLKVRVESSNRTLIPDLTVICGELERSEIDSQAITNPKVIFEVLSPSTEAYDQGPKLHQYRRIPSLSEYVVVAQDRRYASVCRRVGDLWAFEDVEAGQQIELQGPGVTISLDELYNDAFGVIVA